MLKYPSCAVCLSLSAQNFGGTPFPWWVLDSSLTSDGVSNNSKVGSPTMGFFGNGLWTVGLEDGLVLSFDGLEMP
jgi:hypothetical protein